MRGKHSTTQKIPNHSNRTSSKEHFIHVKLSAYEQGCHSRTESSLRETFPELFSESNGIEWSDDEDVFEADIYDEIFIEHK